MKKSFIFLFILSTFFIYNITAQNITTLYYTHPNDKNSIAGLQAQLFADKVFEFSNGTIKVLVYPDSQLGTLTEQEQLLKTGLVAFSHNTAASMGTLFEDFSVLDTPFIYRDIQHLLKVTDPNSEVMQELNKGILKKSNVKVLYSFYFGTRQLTCNSIIKKTLDLRGLKIRCIPFPIYKTAVEAMGAHAIPLDWVATPPALKAKKIDGQENPVNTILSAKLWESQKYLMLTNHIIPAEIVVMNNKIWNTLSKMQQEAIEKAAKIASEFATKTTIENEAADLSELKQKGMIIIDKNTGLDIDDFKERTKLLIQKRFYKKWKKYYKMIENIK